MMRQHNNNTTSQDRHDGEKFDNASLQTSKIEESPALRRLRVPIWKRLRAFCIVLVFLGVVELGAASLTASSFNVKTVKLEGLVSTPTASVEEIAQTLTGQNLLRVNSKRVIQLIEQIPTIETVQVRRAFSWPPKLKVIVQERQPFAVIGGADQWWIVDKSGVPYRQISGAGVQNLEMLTGPNFHPQLGKPLPAAQWQKVTHLLQTMKQDQKSAQNAFRWDLRRVYFDRNGNVSLRLKDAPHEELLVRLGTDQWSAKLQRARRALAYLEKTGQRAKELNLVSYKLPTWTPKQVNSVSADESQDHQSA